MPLDETPTPFCTMCFATGEDGSWGEVVVAGHCMNCGANGTAIPVPKWAIEDIRKNASWVGKRYYPADEDKEAVIELRLLRNLVTEHAGRTVRLVDGLKEGEPKRWWVTQERGNGRNTAVTVETPDAQDALLRARTQLPYVDPKVLG